MKKIIDTKGTFQIFVPFTWMYWMMEGEVHSFEENKIEGFSECFQLSLSPLKADEKTTLADLLGHLPPTQVGNFDLRSYDDTIYDECITKAWSTIYGNQHIYLTYTYSTNSDYSTNSLKEKLEVIYSAFSTFYLIQDDEREKILTSYRFETFLQGIGAADLLLKKAIENKAFFEATCLLGNQIDSLLRIGIILKRQIINSNDVIEREWIYQGNDDKKKSEKDIYKTSLNLNVVTEEVYKSLFEIYEDRNRVVHRFIISEITLAEVEQIAYDYYFLREDIKLMAPHPSSHN